MKRNWIILLLFIIFAVFISFMLFRFEFGRNDDNIVSVIPKNAVIYTDEESVVMLKDEKQYAMTDLILQEIYLIEQELNVDFWFKENTAQSQIDNARSFIITRFVLRSGEGAFLGSGPYVDIIQNKDITWNIVSCRIYVGDELAYHEVYNEKGQLINP